jgi:hypothetical protein
MVLPILAVTFATVATGLVLAQINRKLSVRQQRKALERYKTWGPPKTDNSQTRQKRNRTSDRGVFISR